MSDSTVCAHLDHSQQTHFAIRGELTDFKRIKILLKVMNFSLKYSASVIWSIFLFRKKNPEVGVRSFWLSFSFWFVVERHPGEEASRSYWFECERPPVDDVVRQATFHLCTSAILVKKCQGKLLFICVWAPSRWRGVKVSCFWFVCGHHPGEEVSR